MTDKIVWPKVGDTVYGCKCVGCGGGRHPRVSRSLTGKDTITMVYSDGTVQVKSGDIYKVSMSHGNWVAEV